VADTLAVNPHLLAGICNTAMSAASPKPSG